MQPDRPPQPVVTLHLDRYAAFHVDVDSQPTGEMLGREYPDYISARTYGRMLAESNGWRLVDLVTAVA
jgi:hypothetical protein